MFYENKITSFLISLNTKPLQFPLHVHQYIEITHVIKGELEMHVGTEKYHLRPGNLAISFPNVPHDYHTLSSENDTYFYVLNCYPDLLPMHKNTLMEKYPLSPILQGDQIHEDVLYAEKRLCEMDPAIDDSISLVSTLVSLILCRICPEIQLTDLKNIPPSDLTCDIIAYISNHYLEDITLTTVANKFGIGKYALSRIFSNVLNINFSAYINSLRINHSKSLLINTDMSIIDVALESGYHNQQTFNRIFKSLSNCTPRYYRENHYGDISLPLSPATSFIEIKQ